MRQKKKLKSLAAIDKSQLQKITGATGSVFDSRLFPRQVNVTDFQFADTTGILIS